MQDSWLTPEGEIIEVGKFKHNEYAKNLLIEEMGFDGYLDFMQENSFDLEYRVLHQRGWVRIKYTNYKPYVTILGDCVDMTKPMKNTLKPAMNDKQMRTAKEICDLEGVDFHKAINHNMFW
jgi:hypothetical protein